MYTVNSVTMYEYAWCLGVQSVTTDNCHTFNKIQFKNHLYEVSLCVCEYKYMINVWYNNYIIFYFQYCHSEVSSYEWLLVLIFLIACVSFVIYCKLK